MIRTIIVKLLLLALLCQCIPNIGVTQPDPDSLRAIWIAKTKPDSLRFKAINTYYKSYTHAVPDSVIIITDYHLEMAHELGEKLEISNALNEKAYAYYLKGDSKLSMDYLKQSIAILEQLNTPISLASVYSNIGNIYGDEKNYQEALKYFYKTLKIFKEQNVKTAEARMLNNIGLLYHLIDSHEIALDHLVQSLNIYNEIGLSKKYGTVLSDISAVHYSLGDYLKAIECGEASIQTLQDNNNLFKLSDSYFTLARSYKQMGQAEKARSYIDKSLIIDQKITNKSKIIERRTFEAELFLDNDINTATLKAEEVLDMVDDDTKYELKEGLYQLLYKCYKLQNKYDLALKMHELQVLYADSLKVQINKTAVIREAIQNEYNEKLYQTQLENELTEKKLKKDHQWKTTLITLVSLSMILLIGFYSRSSIKGSKAEKQALLDEIERLKKIDATLVSETNKFSLNRNKIEAFIHREINETDWKVLNILLDDPVIPNKDIAEKAFMSVDGIGSSLRRMYDYFEIKESKYKKISLLMLAIKISNDSEIG